MLRWDDFWWPEKARLDSLSDRVREQLAIGCIDVAWRNLAAEVRGQEPLGTMVAALCEMMAVDVKDLVRLNDDADASDMPGHWHIAMAIVTVLGNRGQLSGRDCLDAISYAYQAVLDQEILSKLERETTETEVREMEAQNRTCRELIEQQLKLLRVIERDGTLTLA